MINRIKYIKNANKIGKFFIYTLCIFNLFIMMFSSDAFYNKNLLEISIKILFFLSCISFFMVFTIKKKTDKYKIFWLLCIIISSFVSYIVHQKSEISDFLILISYYITLPIYIIVIPEFEFNKTDSIYFKIISQIYFLFFFYSGYFRATYRIGTDALLLGYTNSNVTGLYIMFVIIMMIIVYRNETKLWKPIKFILLIEEFALFYLLTMTMSRTASLIALLCILYSICPDKIEIRIGKLYSIVCYILPSVFLYVYTLMFFKGWFINLNILGSSLYSGRQILFQQEFLGFSLFGMLDKCGYLGLNMALAIINTWGFVGFILYSIFFVLFLNSDFLDMCDMPFKNHLMRFSISTILLHGCTECCIFTGGSVYSGMMACILMAGASAKYNK